MKTLIIPNSIKQIEDLHDFYDGFIVGLKDLSVNMNLYLTIDEINSLKTDKEVFIAINKNIHNKDLTVLEESLKNLKNIKAVLYYDAAVVSLFNKIKPNYDLVWSQEHLTTSSVTCNYWYSKNVNYVYLSGEITLDEILNIKSQTKMKVIAPIFGYLPMFVSKRHLIKNYLDCFKIKDSSKKYYLRKENKLYPIKDDKVTEVYSNDILNGLKEKEKFEKIDYVTFNAFNIEDEKFKKVLVNFQDNLEVDDLFDNLGDCFLYKETIYRVKKND